MTLDVDVAMAAPPRPTTSVGATTSLGTTTSAGAVAPSEPSHTVDELAVAVVPLDSTPVRKPVVRPVRLVSEQVASAPVPMLLHPERLWSIGSFR